MLWLQFSRRYMFSPKSHSVINIIACVSVIAVAIPTAAMIILLAMFGGLSHTIDSIYSLVDADIEIIPSRGQTFDAEAIDFEAISQLDGVEATAPYLEQSIMAATASRRTTLQLRGIDSTYTRVLPLEKFVARGSVESLAAGEIIIPSDIKEFVGIAQTIHIKMKQRDRPFIFIDNSECGAGDPAGTAQSTGKAPGEGGLARSEIAEIGDHIAPTQTARQFCAQRLCLLCIVG